MKSIQKLQDNPHIFFALTAFALILPFIILGPYSYSPLWDSADSFFSRYVTMAKYVGDHGIFYWYPFSSGGADIASNVVRYFDINFLFFLVLPDWLVLPLQRFLGHFVAGYFTYKLCRDYLKLGKYPSYIAGLVFLLNQTYAYYHFFGVGFVPLVIWAFEKILEQKSWAKKILLALAIGVLFALTASFILDIAFSALTILIWFLVLRYPKGLQFLPLFIVFILACLAVQTDSLMATRLNLEDSHRFEKEHVLHSFDLTKFLFSKRTWYLAILLLLFPLSLKGSNHKAYINKPRMIILVICGLALTNLIIHSQGPAREFVQQFSETLAGTSYSKFARAMHLIYGVAFGILIHNTLLAEKTRKFITDKLVIVVFAGIIALIPLQKAFLNTAYNWITQGSYYTFFHSPRLKTLAKHVQEEQSPYRTVFISRVLEPGLLQTYGLETADGYMNMYSRRYFDFWNTLIRPYLQKNNLQNLYEMHDNEHYIYFDPYRLDAAQSGVVIDDMISYSALSLANVKYVVSEFKLATDKLKPWPETLPGKIWAKRTTKEKIWQNLQDNFHGRNFVIYENPEVLPRWYMAYETKSYSTKQELENLILNSSSDDLKKTVFLENYTSLQPDKTSSNYDIKPIIYAPDQIVLEIKTEKDGFLVLTNTYSKFWECKIHDTPCEILPAYGTFWAVSLKAGRNLVEFQYSPPYSWKNLLKVIPYEF